MLGLWKRGICLLLVLPLQLMAQGTVTDGGTSVSVSSFGSDGMYIGTNGLGGADQIFAVGFWYRADGDTQEYPVTNAVPDSESYVGDTATLVYNDVGGRGLFSAEVLVVVEEYSATNAQVRFALSLTPLDGISTVDVFFYADPDMDGTLTDNAELVFIAQEINTDAILVYDQTCMEMVGLSLNNDPIEIMPADAYQGGPFSGIRSALNDAALTELDNSGLPFGPGDFTAAFQFEDQSTNLQWFGLMNFAESGATSTATGARCGTPDVPVPGPGPLALTFLVLLMLGCAWHFRGRFV